jgi:hypothetical protein
MTLRTLPPILRRSPELRRMQSHRYLQRSRTTTSIFLPNWAPHIRVTYSKTTRMRSSLPFTMPTEWLCKRQVPAKRCKWL